MMSLSSATPHLRRVCRSRGRAVAAVLSRSTRGRRTNTLQRGRARPLLLFQMVCGRREGRSLDDVLYGTAEGRRAGSQLHGRQCRLWRLLRNRGLLTAPLILAATPLSSSRIRRLLTSPPRPWPLRCRPVFPQPRTSSPPPTPPPGRAPRTRSTGRNGAAGCTSWTPVRCLRPAGCAGPRGGGVEGVVVLGPGAVELS
jgi:hypothetical protein